MCPLVFLRRSLEKYIDDEDYYKLGLGLGQPKPKSIVMCHTPTHDGVLQYLIPALLLVFFFPNMKILFIF